MAQYSQRTQPMHSNMAMDVERLIQSVKSHVFLYDLGHKDYKNTTRKASVWETIAEELNENSETVKLKWKTVRDGYIKFKKQQKDAKNNNKKVINYIWSAQLKFLDDFQVSRKKPPASESLLKALQLSEDEDETPTQSYLPGSILIPSPSASGPFRNEQTARPRRTSKRKTKEKNINLDTPIQSPVKNKKPKQETEHYDATDHLFLSYSETFKTFSPREQALLKVELAKLFSNAELNALQKAENLQESLVAGSSPGYMNRNNDRLMNHLPSKVHTVEDEDSDDDDIEFVSPSRTRLSSDTTG